MMAHAGHAQDVYPVVDPGGTMVGIVTHAEIQQLSEEPGLETLVNAADLMRPSVAVHMRDDLHMALETMLAPSVTKTFGASHI